MVIHIHSYLLDLTAHMLVKYSQPPSRMQMSSFSQAFRKARLIYQAITRLPYTLPRQPLSLPSM
jgi:hypothetical protein